ncbi:hypothetical protein PM082_002347 [Marasmius tenuissimus]|nr:hypothetical protein PM082_002347 [Marasmius tenuissimus]
MGQPREYERGERKNNLGNSTTSPVKNSMPRRDLRNSRFSPLYNRLVEARSNATNMDRTADDDSRAQGGPLVRCERETGMRDSLRTDALIRRCAIRSSLSLWKAGAVGTGIKRLEARDILRTLNIGCSNFHIKELVCPQSRIAKCSLEVTREAADGSRYEYASQEICNRRPGSRPCYL